MVMLEQTLIFFLVYAETQSLRPSVRSFIPCLSQLKRGPQWGSKEPVSAPPHGKDLSWRMRDFENGWSDRIRRVLVNHWFCSMFFKKISLFPCCTWSNSCLKSHCEAGCALPFLVKALWFARDEKGFGLQDALKWWNCFKPREHGQHQRNNHEPKHVYPWNWVSWPLGSRKVCSHSEAVKQDPAKVFVVWIGFNNALLEATEMFQSHKMDNFWCSFGIIIASFQVDGSIPPKNSFCSIPPKTKKLPRIGNHTLEDQVSAARITGADDAATPESNASKVQFKAYFDAFTKAAWSWFAYACFLWSLDHFRL